MQFDKFLFHWMKSFKKRGPNMRNQVSCQKKLRNVH